MLHIMTMAYRKRTETEILAALATHAEVRSNAKKARKMEKAAGASRRYRHKNRLEQIRRFTKAEQMRHADGVVVRLGTH